MSSAFDQNLPVPLDTIKDNDDKVTRVTRPGFIPFVLRELWGCLVVFAFVIIWCSVSNSPARNIRRTWEWDSWVLFFGLAVAMFWFLKKLLLYFDTSNKG